MNYIFALLLILTTALPDSIGQDYDTGTYTDAPGVEQRREVAETTIRELKDGVLIVRLKTGSNKINAMQSIVDNKDVDAETRDAYMERINEEKEHIRTHNLALRAAFKEKYDFSKVLFMYDTSVHQLMDGIKSGYFLNEAFKPDRSLSLADSPFYVTFHGTTASSTQTTVEGMVVLDAKMEELSDPFPFFTGMSTIRKSFAKIFNKTDEKELYSKLVERFNDRLREFHYKSSGNR